MMLSLTSCEPYDWYYEDGYRDDNSYLYGEDIISYNKDCIFTKEVWQFSEGNYDWFILGLEEIYSKDDYSATFLWIKIKSDYYGDSKPSSTFYSLMPVAEAIDEVRYQNNNTYYNFETRLQPCVYENQKAWKAVDGNDVLLIEKNESYIRPNLFWETWAVEYEFITESSFWIHKKGSSMAWNYQIRNEYTRSGEAEAIVVEGMNYNEAKASGLFNVENENVTFFRK